MNRPLLIFSLWPIAEIAAFIIAGDRFGVLPVLAETVATAFLGGTLFRLQAPGLLRRVQIALQREEPPTAAVADGIGLALAALLLIMPGLMTDALGLLFAIPMLRRGLLGPIWRVGDWQVRTRGDRHGARRGRRGQDSVIDGEFVDVSAQTADTEEEETPKRRPPGLNRPRP